MKPDAVEVDLTEHEPRGGIMLDARQLGALITSRANLRVQPDPASSGAWQITASSRIGTACIEGLELRIWPKIPISSLFRMLATSTPHIDWGDQHARLAQNHGVDDIIAHALLDSIDGALPSGIVRGYVALDEQSSVVRGQLDLGETIQRSPALLLPFAQQVELHEVDVAENQLLASALRALGTRVGSDDTRARLRRAVRHFAAATPIDLRRGVPPIARNRLNARWWDAIELGRLALHSMGLHLSTGQHRAREFLVDMNLVFERFVRDSLARLLSVHGMHLTRRPQPLWLDDGRRHELRPDLTAWSGTRCLFVGDCKYKMSESADAQRSDLYQMLAYASAAGLRESMLIYAASSDVRRSREITIASTDRPVRVRIRALRLDASRAVLEADLEELAREVAQMAASASHPPR